LEKVRVCKLSRKRERKIKNKERQSVYEFVGESKNRKPNKKEQKTGESEWRESERQ
jgi:hypothetical protein